MKNFHILVVGAVLAFLARVWAVDADELLVQQLIRLHMTELRVGESATFQSNHVFKQTNSSYLRVSA